MGLYAEIRKRLRERKRIARRQARLSRCGEFETKQDDGKTVIQGYGLNLGHIFDGDGVAIVEEIFKNGEYRFDLGAPCIVIDIGMNIGLASLYFASRNDVKQVYGYEPFKPTYDQALFNFRINPDCAGKIHPYNFGLGDKEDQLTLDYYAKAPGRMSTVKAISEIPHSAKYPTVRQTVQIRRASQAVGPILEQHKGERIVLKCDTEGAEKEIFLDLDAAGMLRRMDVIMAEYHFSRDTDLVELLKRNGFVFFQQRTVTLQTGDFGIIRAVRKS